MRAAAILTSLDTHLDHLGVLSDILNIPLIVTEDHMWEAAKTFYPQINVSRVYLSELSLEYLADNFDVIFETGKFWAADLSLSLELLYGKKMRFVFCPHGNSDKGHSIQELALQDLSLVYGDHLLDVLKKNRSLERIKSVVRTGNYRLPYYLKHKEFFDRIAQEHVFSHFKETKPIALYAPTWNSAESPTSFFAATGGLIEQLGNDFNLLIKLHPLLLEQQPAQAYALMGRYEGHSSVHFVTAFPPIYPLLAKSVCYIGDYSSIGYDFLAFDRPLFFVSSKTASPLSRCGHTVEDTAKDLSQIKQLLKHDIFATARKETYHYAFGEERSFELLSHDIFNQLGVR